MNKNSATRAALAKVKTESRTDEEADDDDDNDEVAEEEAVSIGSKVRRVCLCCTAYV